MNLKLSIKQFSLLICVGVMTQMYQNCGEVKQFDLASASDGQLSSGSSVNPDTAHPQEKDVTLPTQRILVANRGYVASLLRSIFTSTTTPVPGLENLIAQWIGNRPPQFGSACNPYDSYSGRDCGGDITNANSPIQADDNTVRESFRLQFCENTLGYDQAVSAVLEKISMTAQAPTAAGIAQVYSLFYRGQDPDVLTVNTLIDLDRSLTQNSETIVNRWRGVILQICESPGWQLL